MLQFLGRAFEGIEILALCSGYILLSPILYHDPKEQHAVKMAPRTQSTTAV